MIIVMGLPGVGKTTVLKNLMQLNKKVSILNYGDLVFSFAKQKFKVSNRDRINLLPEEKHKELQRLAIKEIELINNKESRIGKILILDTHAALKKPTGFMPGLSYELLSKIPIEVFIFIDAPTKEILARRERDVDRKRPTFVADDINSLREASLSMLNVYSAAIGKPYYVLINKEGKVDETVKELNRIISKFSI